jgi:hypothetical protein
MVKKEKKDGKELTIHFMPYSEIANLDSMARIKKILAIVLQNKIIVLQGRLRPEEEGKLIEHTMTLIDHIKGFSGIEIASISNESKASMFEQIRGNLAKILVGEKDAMTIIGPANIVKEIKKNPNKLELMLKRK